MQDRQKRIFNIGFLFVFLIVTLGINFFHTEDNAQSSKDCSACHFLNSTIATNQINFFHLPQLTLLETLKTIEDHQFYYIYLIPVSSRSPPQA